METQKEIFEVRFCTSCGTILSDYEKKYCEECEQNLSLAEAAKYEQLVFPAEVYKPIGGKNEDKK